MKLRTLVALVIQLMAIHFILHILLNWGLTLFAGNIWATEDSPDLGAWMYRVFVASAVVLSIFLCAFAKDIAAKFVATDETIALGNLTLVDCYTIAFFTVGLAFLYQSVSDGVYFVVENLKAMMTGRGASTPLDLWNFLKVLGPPLIGFLVLLNARDWAVAYARKQGIAVSEPIPSPQPPEEQAR